MKLIKGETYELIESCGMMVLQGKYLGKGRYDNNEDVLVFELLNRTNENQAKFAAVKPEVSISYDGNELNFRFRTSYYGMTIEGIKPVTIWYRKEQPTFKLNEI